VVRKMLTHEEKMGELHPFILANELEGGLQPARGLSPAHSVVAFFQYPYVI
jgi:hypothetical protein